jgi:DNA polymerase-3 subunit alpha
LILRYAQVLHDMPSHLTIHACGLLLSHKSMHYYTATNLPPKGFPVAHIDMHVPKTSACTSLISSASGA